MFKTLNLIKNNYLYDVEFFYFIIIYFLNYKEKNKIIKIFETINLKNAEKYYPNYYNSIAN